MRKLTATLCLMIAVLLGSAGVSESADFQKGYTAYKSGDYATALREFQPLAKQGNDIAQTILGVMYENGQGVPQDYKTAVKWYRLAAEQGYAVAQHNLGVMYQKGWGVPQNDKTAVKWYRLAAEQGDAGAQFVLGVMYAFGNGVLKDYVYAHMWGNIASKNGNENGAKLRDDFEKKMTPAQIAEAKKLSSKCIQKKYKGCMKSSSKSSQVAKKTPSKSAVEQENERLRKEIARLKKQNQSKPKQVAKKPKPKKSPPPSSGSTGSGFFVSKLGHIVTNEHVIRQCGSVTVGDNANKQVTASVLETDKRNDLALLRISSTQMASVETKSLINKLGLKLVPLASGGLMRSDDIELGESVLVAGYPYGELYSNTIKVTGGMVSSNKGMGDDSGQFQMDAAVQPGNSGRPIYDENGNIVGVVVAQLNKLKVAKAIGSLPENVNFGIKASTVRQFLTSAGLPTKWSNRTERKSTKELAQIAKNQTVMVVCNP